jgi:hypothetical protein
MGGAMARRILAACGSVAALAFATAALAADLKKSSEGWIYFHRAGAGVAEHNAAVSHCVIVARQMGAPSNAGGLAGALLSDLAQGATVAPDIESCMVSTGWEVVQLDEAEGAAISRLDQKGQADALAPWVGSATPHGTVVRRFEPLARLGRGEIALSKLMSNRRLPLSVTATPLNGVAPKHAWKYRMLDANLDPAKAPPGSAFIVIRLALSGAHNERYNFVRLDDAASSAELLSPETPHKWRPKPDDYTAKTYVLVATPGRWVYFGPWAVTLCLGSPGFDIAPGEVVFAGTFTAGVEDPFAPNMDPAPALADLKDPALKARMRPAKWVNGYRYDCDVFPYIYYPYRVDFPGFPSLPDNPPPAAATATAN